MKENEKRNELNREELRKNLQDSTQSMKVENSKLRAIIEENLLLKRSLEKDQQSTVEENQRLQQKIAKLQIKNQELEHLLAEQKIKVQSGTIYQEELRKAKTEISNL